MQCAIETRLTDGELLGRYSDEEDQQAFAELVQRYQPMVIRVCRHVLAGGQEVDDASQQVFVALSLKAAALKDRESVASWLYRAAWNISNRFRRDRCVRRTHENLAGAAMPRVAAVDRPEPDTLTILQEALAEIPDIYSEAIVLHYFCGYTVAETAARLRCPAGTVAARVSRGLERLRARLGDRGLILTALGIKLLMLSAMGGSKAKAAAAVAKGGLPGAGPVYRFKPQRRFLRVGRVFGLAPAISTLAAWGRPFIATSHAAPGGCAASSNALWATWLKDLLASISPPLKQLAPVVIVLGCVGAGVAAKGIWIPYHPAGNGDKPATSASNSANAAEPAAEKSDSSNKDDSNHQWAIGASAGVSAVPEPSSACLLLGGASALLVRRRRPGRGRPGSHQEFHI